MARRPERLTVEEMNVQASHPGKKLLKKGKVGRITMNYLVEKELRDIIAEKGFVSTTEKTGGQ